MNLRKVYFFLALLIITNISWSQSAATINEYIVKYKDVAIAEMQRTGVPASITLAQGIHESGAGTSDLVQRSNNHFGIKCKSNWTGESVRHDDDAKGECFRKYPAATDSYRDHSDFLKNGQRYAFLFQMDPVDYKAWAYGLKKAGYATNPKYPQVLIKLIEDYHLQDYTLIALGKRHMENNLAIENDIKEESNENIITEAQQIDETAGSISQKSYPEGEFKINETKVIFVKKGTSFLVLAEQYNIPLARLFDFNELSPAEESTKDQLIFLQRKRKTGNNEYHIVQPGEMLNDIAQTEAIRLESLAELNWLRPDDKPAPGEKLSLKRKAAVMPKLMVRENFSLIPKDKNGIKPTN